MTDKLPIRRIVQITLGAILLVALCLTGYRRGYISGHGAPTISNANQSQIYNVVYDVNDLVTPLDEPNNPELRQRGFDQLIDLIVSTVEHDSWLESGTGEGEIQPFPANQSLVISQTGRVHDQIADLLVQLRKLGGDVDIRNTIPLMQSMAVYKNANTVAIRTAPAGPKNAAVIDQLFQSAVDKIADRWGKPEFRGEARDPDFPDWSHADRLAMWPRGDGYAFIAVTEEAPAGRALRVGWRGRE